MIIWDKQKNEWLKRERKISFEEIAEKIIYGKIMDIIKNPSRQYQKVFVINIHNYIYAVPFIMDDNENIILKTAYPSRKLYSKYGGNNET